MLGVSVLRHSQKKPDGAEMLAPYFGCKDEEIIVIGDRISTDVVYGNRINACTVLVTEIITSVGDNPFAVVVF